MSMSFYYRNVRSQLLENIDGPKKGAWLRVTSPTNDEIKELAEKYKLDVDLLKDGIDLYEVPRIEHDDGNLYIYVRYCLPSGSYTSTHPMLIVVTSEMVVTVSRIESEPAKVLIDKGVVVTTQKVKLVLELLEQINREYRKHLNSVTKKILSTRTRLQRKIVSNDDIIDFIDTEEDLNEFLAALQPYGILLQALVGGKYLRLYEDDKELIEDLQLSTAELIELTKSRLKTIQNIREAYSTIAANNLNRIFKRLTSIAIFMSIPTIIGGFYGMNVALPFGDHPQAFWIVSGITLTIMTTFIIFFRRSRWL